VEQLTYLLFLEMADEQHPFGVDRIVPGSSTGDHGGTRKDGRAGGPATMDPDP